MSESMHADDQSFADLMELCGEHFGKRPRTDTTGPFDRPHGRHRSNKSSSSSDSTGDLLARLCLRQEDMLNAMLMDRSFIVFLQCGKGNIMPLMLQISKDWHHNRQHDGVTQPLRQLLFRTLIEEFSKRAHMLKFDARKDVLVKGLRTRQILTQSNHWNFLGWDHNAKCLKPTKQDPLNSTPIGQDADTHSTIDIEIRNDSKICNHEAPP